MAASGQIYNETTWSFVYYEQNEQEESKRNRIFDEITKQTSEKKNTMEQQKEKNVFVPLFRFPSRSVRFIETCREEE